MMTPTNNDDDEETMQEDASRTFCSILNVVIDHSMEPPNPLMEPEEWKQQRETQNKKDTSNSNTRLVPVIRVFGPVLRHSEHQHYYQPLQSACLYIHGAFPYLLARPVMAGPDGSLRRASPGSGQVDWDNAASIERIVNTIAATLETSLHSLDMYGKEDSKNNNSDAPAKAKTGSHPIVRKVTVVEGRGFYTYCPGPPAPFLRVEYYDPKLRWKVKMMLERGLELPLSYHPGKTRTVVTFE